VILALPVFLQLASEYAPTVAPATLAAFAQHESGLNPNSIHDNTTGLSFYPDKAEAAVALARLLLIQGHSLDLGIMQINCANLVNTGLTVETAFSPAQSIRAGSQILVAAYLRCRHGGQVDPQAALRCAASVYNAGNEQAGILNGYQARVWKAAAQIVPAIQVAGALPPVAAEPGAGENVATPVPPAPVVMEDLLHGGPPVPLSGAGLDDALPHHGDTR
jgi:type IV secretion system protein VirB1